MSKVLLLAQSSIGWRLDVYLWWDRQDWYLNYFHVLDSRSWTWSRIDAKFVDDLIELHLSSPLVLCVGNFLITWNNSLLSVAERIIIPSEVIQVAIFDLRILRGQTWRHMRKHLRNVDDTLGFL